MPDPINRMEALQPLSREHHHGLLLCWKIKEGISRNIAAERIKRYVDWFWETYLCHHFEIEENIIFPILGLDHEWVKQAIKEHRRLKRLFTIEKNAWKAVSLIEEELRLHIRFEERVLFNEIQKIATEDQLKAIYHSHNTCFKDNLKDEFWKISN